MLVPLVYAFRTKGESPLGMGIPRFGQRKLTSMLSHTKILGEHHPSQRERNRLRVEPDRLHVVVERRIVIHIRPKPVLVSQGDLKKRFRKLMIGRQPEPAVGLVAVIRNLRALCVTPPDFKLRRGVARHGIIKQFLRNRHRVKLCHLACFWQGLRSRFPPQIAEPRPANRPSSGSRFRRGFRPIRGVFHALGVGEESEIQQGHDAAPDQHEFE